MSGNNSGWNRPRQSAEIGVRSAKKAPSAVKGIVAGLVTVCALAALCLWMFSGGDETPKAKPDKDRRSIKTVASKSPDKVQSVERVDSNSGKADVQPVASNLTETAATTNAVKERKTLKPYGWVPKEKRRFHTHTDSVIASIVLAKPGQRVAYRHIDPDKFDQDFVNSLSVKIDIKEDDSEEDKAAKQAVIEAREAIKQEIKETGRKPHEIVKECMNELRATVGYRMDMQKGLAELRKKGASPEEVADYVTAANKVLEKYGMKDPIRMPLRDRIKQMESEKEKGGKNE